MRILYVAGREQDYERNDVVVRALRRFASVELVAPTNRGATSVSENIRVLLRAMPRVLRGDYDLLFIGFYGYFLAHTLGRLASVPVIFDAFVSNYDTLCHDRRRWPPDSWFGRFLYHWDRSAAQMAYAVLLDTPQHADYFVRMFQLAPEAVHWIPVGCNQSIFRPMDLPPTETTTQVLFYCTYLPLHGAEIVVQAAALLRKDPILFRLIGEGPEYRRVRALAESTQADNIHFMAPMPRLQLFRQIVQAHIGLGGHFGASAKAGRVIPGKLYQLLAVRRPVIAASNRANRVFLQHGLHAYLVPPQDADALAQAILLLHRSPELREHLAQEGHRQFQAFASEETITEKLRTVVEETLARPR